MMLVLPAGQCTRENPPSIEAHCDATLEDRNRLAAALPDPEAASDQVAVPAASLVLKTDNLCNP